MPDLNVSRSEPPVPLRDYVEARLNDLCRYLEARLKAIEEAVGVASYASDKRLDAMNEFRASLKDQNVLFMTKAEAKAQWDSIEKDLRILRNFQATLEGKASQRSVTGAFALGALGLAISLISLALKIAGG